MRLSGWLDWYLPGPRSTFSDEKARKPGAGEETVPFLFYLRNTGILSGSQTHPEQRREKQVVELGG